MIDIDGPINQLERGRNASRALCFLERRGVVRTLRDVTNFTESELLKVKLCGRKTLKEIKESLSKAGFRLREWNEPLSVPAEGRSPVLTDFDINEIERKWTESARVLPSWMSSGDGPMKLIQEIRVRDARNKAKIEQLTEVIRSLHDEIATLKGYRT